MGFLDGSTSAAMVARVPCFVSLLYLLCLSLSCVVMAEISKFPGSNVDLYSTSINVLQWRDERLWNASVHSAMIRDSKKGWRDVVYEEKPVDVDIAHGVSLVWPVILSTLCILSFVFTTARMESESEDGAMNGPYSLENGMVTKSSSVVFWTSLFVGSVAVLHVLFASLIVTPACWERVALVWVLLFLPLAVMSQPRQCAMYQSRSPYSSSMSGLEDGQDDLYPIPPCGIHLPVGSVIVFFLGVWCAATSIKYDPDSYRAQLLGIVAGIDLFVLGLGHLWDSPPSIRTVVNSRLVYCVLMLVVVCAVYPQPTKNLGFAVEYKALTGELSSGDESSSGLIDSP